MRGINSIGLEFRHFILQILSCFYGMGVPIEIRILRRASKWRNEGVHCTTNSRKNPAYFSQNAVFEREKQFVPNETD